jgi:hypothetical protein
MATQTNGGDSVTTSGIELTEGRHYWEVELLSEEAHSINSITRPNLTP